MKHVIYLALSVTLLKSHRMHVKSAAESVVAGEAVGDGVAVAAQQRGRRAGLARHAELYQPVGAQQRARRHRGYRYLATMDK